MDRFVEVPLKGITRLIRVSDIERVSYRHNSRETMIYLKDGTRLDTYQTSDFGTDLYYRELSEILKGVL